ncbi:SRPBCC domain-containing protein [Cohnella sp. GCM10027633]|uniref:SRPBCC domain-containing protein n=1 Tax=unclassified Cohnella TaxID=2636738 RepID=UPI00362D8557
MPAVTFAGAEARVFTLKRIFNAPRSLVFQAYSQPEHLKHWWGPRGWTLTVCNIDFRAGGSWHYCMKCMDESQGDYYGMESWGKAIYKEIVPNEKIVLVDYFSDAEGTESGDLPASESTWQFFDQGDQTLMVSTSTYASEEALRQVVEMGMEQGITETLDRLAERLAELR